MSMCCSFSSSSCNVLIDLTYMLNSVADVSLSLIDISSGLPAARRCTPMVMVPMCPQRTSGACPHREQQLNRAVKECYELEIEHNNIYTHTKKGFC